MGHLSSVALTYFFLFSLAGEDGLINCCGVAVYRWGFYTHWSATRAAPAGVLVLAHVQGKGGGLWGILRVPRLRAIFSRI